MQPDDFPATLQKKRPLIGVIGAAKASPNGYAQAEEIGRLIAERGGAVVCGGLGGVMEGACRGCSRQGGETIGILPGSEACEANPYVSLAITTNMGHARNVIIAHTSQALIAIEGEYGTLSEMAVALKLGRPVIAIASWPDIPGVVYVASPEEAVAEVFARIS
ncbi:MAG: TIGR00725 family protein [Deltaproteobacteria bacterium]|nr:TIGR00725 family protein [Deltaproteobacteria bacterium]